MRSYSTAVACVAVSSLGANAINLAKRTDGPARVVQHDIYRKNIADPIARVEQDRNRMRKRDGTVSVTLDNEETLYFMNATIGTPAQSFQMHIDTGSSDLWVNAANSDFCSQRNSGCDVSGTYSANDSSTYTYKNSLFNITYADGSGASGDYALDTVSFGGISLDQQEFGIGYVSTSAECILGIGYSTNEAIVAYNGDQPYRNVPQSLMDNGDIASNAYSLWLNDLDASTGQILFGGVNTDKYTGSLQTLPIIQEASGVYAEFIIALTAVGYNGDNSSLASDLATPALLDSGTSLMYLPDDITSAIYSKVGASYDSSEGVATVDCSLSSSSDTIDFTFSSPVISVGMNELVIVAGTDRRGQDVCILGVAPAGSSTPVLGDTFLRSAYVVYDLTNNEISLAQTNFNSTSDNIMEITNSTGVPDATVVTNAVTDVAVSTGGARIGDTYTTITESSFGQATPAPAYNLAAMGVFGAAALFAL